MKYEIGSLITSNWSKGAVWKVESYDQKSPGLVNLSNFIGGKSRQDYVANFKAATAADLARVQRSGRYGSRDRVSEFIRQWKISYETKDEVYVIHFDDQTDQSASLLISDLERLLK